MNPGDLVTTKNRREFHIPKVGLFMGMRTFKSSNLGDDYTCAEVIWFGHTAPNGDVVSTIQADLIEVVK
jgi:hypothetical protein